MLVPINNLFIEQTNIGVSEVRNHYSLFSIQASIKFTNTYYCTVELTQLSFHNNWKI